MYTPASAMNHMALTHNTSGQSPSRAAQGLGFRVSQAVVQFVLPQRPACTALAPSAPSAQQPLLMTLNSYSHDAAGKLSVARTFRKRKPPACAKNLLLGGRRSLLICRKQCCDLTGCFSLEATQPQLLNNGRRIRLEQSHAQPGSA
jgi:hypothetical protein